VRAEILRDVLWMQRVVRRSVRPSSHRGPVLLAIGVASESPRRGVELLGRVVAISRACVDVDRLRAGAAQTECESNANIFAAPMPSACAFPLRGETCRTGRSDCRNARAELRTTPLSRQVVT